MTWHFLIGNPGRHKIPRTHCYRQITHEEFRSTARFLEIYRLKGRIIVGDCLHSKIMSRITGMDTHTLFCGLYKHDNLPKHLESDDHVLVLRPKVFGHYIYIAYEQADERKFKEMVETGVIEPVNAKDRQPARLASLAQALSSANKRMRQAQKLLESSGSDSGKEELANLLREYESERQRILSDELLSEVSSIEELLARYQEEREEAEAKLRETYTRLQIEYSVNDGIDEQKRLKENAEILEKSLKTYDETISDLQSLVSEARAPTRPANW